MTLMKPEPQSVRAAIGQEETAQFVELTDPKPIVFLVHNVPFAAMHSWETYMAMRKKLEEK